MDTPFSQSLEKIPRQLRELPNARFAIINGNTKADSSAWDNPSNPSYTISDPLLAEYLTEGRNYGVCCGFGGLCVIDLNDLARLEALGVLPRMQSTFAIKTGHGQQHYVTCTNLSQQIGFYDPELNDEEGLPFLLVQVRSRGQQVAGPGSINPDGTFYEVINDAPIAIVTKGELLSWFDGLMPVKVEDISSKTGGDRHGDEQANHFEYDQSEFEKPVKMAPFVELVGGRLAEVVARNDTIMFCVHDPATGAVEYLPEVEHRGTIIVPPKKDRLFEQRGVILPTEAEDYGTERELYDEIRSFVHRYLEVSPDYEAMASFYPMLTYVYDIMPAIVYLRARGDWGTGKSRFLEVFGAICYRSTFATGAASEAVIYRSIDKWRGTLLVEEADFEGRTKESHDLAKILNCGYEQNKPVLRCDPKDPTAILAFNPFCPKILCTRFEFKDKALESRCFTEIMSERTREDIPIELPPEFHDEALRIRNKLLLYRFKNRSKIQKQSQSNNMKFDQRGLPPRMQQAARPLSVVVGDNPELQALLRTFLEEKERALVLEASETVEGQIIRILSEEKPKQNGDELTWNLIYGDVAKRIIHATGESGLTAARARSRGNSLGLKTRLVWAGGKNNRFLTCESKRFNWLKRRYIPLDPHDPHDAMEAGESFSPSSGIESHDQDVMAEESV